MVRVDAAWAMALFLGIGIVVVFAFWMFYSWEERSLVVEEEKGLEQCSYCTYVFLSDGSQGIIQCPRCKSLLDRPGRPAMLKEGDEA